MTEPQTQLMLPSADPLTRTAFTSFNQLYLTLICYAFLLPDLKATKKNRLQAVKGEILDVIKQIAGSWYSWIGIYHIAFGDSEVQSSNSSGNSCYFNLVQIRLRLKLYENKKAVHSFILPSSAVYGFGLSCRKLISTAVYRYSPQLMAIGESRNVDWVGNSPQQTATASTLLQKHIR